MKRFLLLLMACATMFASCQKDADLAMDADGGMVDVAISATMEGTSATTRAIDDKGDGTEVDRCIMEVYLDDGTLYKRMVTSTIKDVDNSDTREVIFNLRLVASQTYDFLFWADKDDTDATTTAADDENYANQTAVVGGGDKYYTTDSYDADGNYLGLTAITASYASYKGNDETRDAFFGQLADQKIESSVSLPVTLKRPFGQLNVSTALTDVPSDMYPAKVQVTYTTAVCTTLNALTGETDSDKTETIVWNEAVNAIEYSSTYDFDKDGDMHLSTDYIFAPYYDADNGEVKQQLVDFEMKFIDAAGNEITTNDNFKSIPIQRNYRTNVSGELLTKQGTITVTIDPEFVYDGTEGDSDINVSIKDVATIAALQEAMDDDSGEIEASYSVADQVDASDASDDSSSAVSIVIPALTDEASTTDETTSRSIELIGGIADGTTLTVSAAGTTTSTAPDVVYITLPEVSADTETGTLEIDLPYSTVYINGTCYGLNAATYTNTLVINEGAKVDGLTIKQGNVEVYGTLTGTVQLAEGNTTATTITVYTATGTFDTASSVGDNITVIYNNPSDPIQNITSGNSYEDLEAAVAAAEENDVIEIAAGTYTLTQDYSTTNDYYNVDGFYLLINTDGLTIRGIGEVIIDSEDFVGSGGTDYAKQNLVTVRADNVTFENLTFYANTNEAYTHDGICYPNKTIELPSGQYFGLTVDGCTFLGADGSKTSGAGRFYLGAKTVTSSETIATIKNSTFYCGAVSVHTGVATIENCTFNGIYFNYEYGINTDGDTIYTGDGYYNAWARNGAELTIKDSSFTNVEEACDKIDGNPVEGISITYAPIMSSGNTTTATEVVATGCTFPSNSGKYWAVFDDNNLSVNGTIYYSDSVESVEDLQTALDNDVAEVSVSYTVLEEVTSENASITIKSVADAESAATSEETTRTFNFVSGIEAETTITIEYDDDVISDATAPDVINITVPEDCAGSIELNVPYSTVYINGSLIEATVWTANDTFIVEAGSSIDNLTINGGNVEIYGTVGTITVASTNTDQGTITIYYGAGGQITEDYTGKIGSYSIVEDKGAGTEANPYILMTAEDLKAIATAVAGGENQSYYLMTNDIDLDSSSWTAIGTDTVPFKGSFDGGGFNITGLYISNTESYQGLFGYIDGATIKNVSVAGSISASSDTGGIAGYSTEYSSIINCHNSANVTTSGWRVGGIVGTNFGDITDSWNSGTIVSTGGSMAGGITGQFNHSNTSTDPSISDDAVISGCYNTGEIRLDKAGMSYIGGIVALSAYNAVIMNCYNTGYIVGQNYYIGGIVGNNTQYAIVINCYNSGNVHHENDALYQSSVAGIVGQNYNSAVVVNCYNSGKITSSLDRSSSYAAGIVAELDRAANVENCYNVGDIDAYGSQVIVGSTIGKLGTTSNPTYSNLYFLDGTVITGNDSKIGEAMTKENMQLQTFVDTLNANVDTYNSATPDVEAVKWTLGDDGYPILIW